VLFKKEANIQCLACRKGRRACSFTRAAWAISVWPKVEETEETRTRRAEATASKKVTRERAPAPAMEKARSEGTVPVIRPARTIKTPARLRDSAEVVLVSGPQVGTPGPSKVVETGRRGVVEASGASAYPRFALGDNWSQPTGRIEPVFFEDLDQWSEILLDDHATFVQLRTAQSQLEAIRDRETGAQQVLTAQFNDRRGLLSAMIEGVRSKATRSSLELDESQDEEGQTVEVLKKKRGGAKQ
jgi:hypothetical protein